MNELLILSVKTLLKETFEGPPEKGSWFTESKPDSGLFGTVEKITATEASIPVHGTTIAAHLEHTRFYLWGTINIFDGNIPKINWQDSWKITSVDQQHWGQIQETLRRDYKTVLEKIDSVDWDEFKANEVLGAIAHSAYHLGAIRQMVKIIKA
ncbi:hypothetical protein [Alkalihalobacillus sp. TS-13]|uniref:hypothetical protein n=1 Tax=Alkalihalobacillus sp. TS-13 TaxID=2842455 RepID=UPI001C887D6F|nr:hypothetical protein [Alkalihalobacillus sp. TS-13]